MHACQMCFDFGKRVTITSSLSESPAMAQVVVVPSNVLTCRANRQSARQAPLIKGQNFVMFLTSLFREYSTECAGCQIQQKGVEGMAERKRAATLEEIAALDKEMLVPTDIAGFLRCQPYAINVLTRDGKNPFPFPVIRIGNRVKIPKRLFIAAMRGESTVSCKPERKGEDDYPSTAVGRSPSPDKGRQEVGLEVIAR